MREIKYKAFEKNLKEIIPVHDIDFEKKMINTSSLWRFFDEIELIQYINYKDLNEKELYESDIIHYHRHEGWYAESVPIYKLGVIAWNNSALGFRIQPIDTHSGKVNYGVDGEKIRTSHRIVKVGNLYESDINKLIKEYIKGDKVNE